ncbi:MAG: benzodiazapine receptor [Myxococcota bacterium]|jgi:benzodiazapine receptor
MSSPTVNESSPIRNLGTTAAFVGLCLIVGFLGSLSTAPAIPGWYAELNKPSWRPPNWLFAPVWTTLYVLIGVVGARLFDIQRRTRSTRAFRFWCAQLALNVLWSPVFFALQQPALALVVIVAMWAAIVGTMRAAAPVDPLSAWLLAPYLTWVTFATALNTAIVALNS